MDVSNSIGLTIAVLQVTFGIAAIAVAKAGFRRPSLATVSSWYRASHARQIGKSRSTRSGRFLIAGLAMLSLGAAVYGRADALPIFAHEYGVPCQKCHTIIPVLNTFGKAFLENGYHIAGAGAEAPVFPVSIKANLLYTSATPTQTGGLPKAVVDELEMLTAGPAGARGHYFVEQYLIDGGQHGSLREAWFDERLSSPGRLPIDLRAGQFTLPVPVDPESIRETYNDYLVFVQTVGANPFEFKSTKPGLSARLGSFERGVNFEFSALNGHDAQSGLPTRGIDLMQTVHELLGPLDVSAYRYSGRRELGSEPLASASDAFTRTGVGLRFAAGRWTSESVLQENTDTNVDGQGRAQRSSGGFSQLRYAITRKLFGLVRYDGTNEPGLSPDVYANGGLFRSTTLLMGYRVSRNSRVTIEDVISRSPVTTNTLSTQLTVGY